MKKKTFKNRAFTIVELLAVIVVLAVVLAIAVPRIMKSIDESNKASFRITGENLMKEAMNQHIQEGMLGEKEYIIEDNEFIGKSLNVTGNLPNNGTIFINDKSKVAFALSNDKYCLKKNIYFDDIEITNDIVDCELDTAIPSRCFMTEDLSSTEIEITGYLNDCPRDVVIPSILNGKTVTSIGEYAFGSYSDIMWYKEEQGKVAYNGSDISNPNIEDKVALGMYNPDFYPITSVVFPDTLVTIKLAAFQDNLIESVIIPNGVVTIGTRAFERNRLTYVSIPNSVISLGYRAFLGNNLLTYDIGTGLTWIPNLAFAFNALKTIKIPDNITEVDYEAFYYGGVGPEELIIGSGISSFGFLSHYYNNILYYTKRLIVNNEQVPSFWQYTTKLESIILGDNVKTVGYQAFQISDLKELILGKNIESIEAWAFMGCDLKEVILPNSLNYIGDYAFNNNELTNITLPNGLEYLGKYAFSTNLLTSINIPNSVTTIREGAFSNNRLTSVAIPGNHVSMGNSVFSSNQITSITFPPGFTTFSETMFSGNSLTSITVPEGVSIIGWGVFYENYLTSIVLPSTLRTLGYVAFANNQITSVTIPANVMHNSYPQNSISLSFASAYEPQRLAGTYTAPSQDGVWTKRP